MPRSVAPLSILAVLSVLAPAAVAGQRQPHESARSTQSGGHHTAHPQPQAPPVAPTLPGLSAAQVVSGPLPAFPAPPLSPFDAAPSTYVPHKRISPFLRPRHSIGLGGFGSPADALPEVTPTSADRADTAVVEPAGTPPIPDTLPADVALPHAPRTVTPAKPVTLYVIPGCYAGDRPPAEGMLPAGCDVATMRAVRIK
jgi:hypothetical protein